MEKICKSCKTNFKIRKEDLIFYDQIKVPPPLCCPDCRMQRRLAFRNERTLYKRVCDLCKKDGISIYPNGTPFPVYCHKCWWGDGQGKEYHLGRLKYNLSYTDHKLF